MRPLAGIVSYEPSELVVTALAGTPLAELEALLARHGQCLAFEPPRSCRWWHRRRWPPACRAWRAPAWARARLRVGRGDHQRPWRAAALWRPGDEERRRLRRPRLMAGSWGQLGVITEVSLKVLPVAPAEATLR